ncbi:MAG: hypothetical protein KBD00_05775 [Candidatus Peribacteraceae bacterium]|nr:hypothetical protein [Candidatus Peribacteraceae bacterium]
MSIIIFLLATSILLIEGWLIAALILSPRERLLCTAFALPIAALSNALLMALFTLISISLTAISLLIIHAILIGVLGFFTMKRKHTHLETHIMHPSHDKISRWKLLLFIPSILIIFSTSIYSFSHAVLLPTFQFDSLTNWTMRSQISFYDQKIAFDDTEARGMAKPQYPFLFHGLQLAINQGQSVWNDRIANTITWLLSVSTFAALWLLIRRNRGKFVATVAIASLFSIPLFSLHTAQGYADIVLAQYFLLALATIAMAIDDHQSSSKKYWLILSALFVSASVWTKSEGFFYGLFPWLIVIAGLLTTKIIERKTAIISSVFALLLSATWPMFALLKQLRLTPHSSDTVFGFHPEALRELWPALFGRGSFGISFFVSIAAILLLSINRKSMNDRKKVLLLLLWGIILFAAILFTYLFTPNARYLMNAEAFYRQMMMVPALWIVASGFLIKNDHKANYEC